MDNIILDKSILFLLFADQLEVLLSMKTRIRLL